MAIGGDYGWPGVPANNIKRKKTGIMGAMNGRDNADIAFNARDARQGLGQEPPVRLPDQEFPKVDLTDARHATPFEPDKDQENVDSFKGGYDFARKSDAGFSEVGRAAQSMPPMASLGAGIGNVANTFLPQPREERVNISQRFPSDLDAAQRMAPQSGQQLPKLPSIPDNIGNSAGRFARESIVPGVDSTLRAAAGIGTFIPRSIYNTGKDFVGGFMGKAPSNETTELLPFNKPMVGQPQPGPGNANAAIMQPQQSNQAPIAGRNDTLRSTPNAGQSELQRDGIKSASFNPTVTPRITDAIKNETTGKVAALYSDGSVNGVPKPERDKGLMGGYKPDGTRIVPSGNQGDQDALRGGIRPGGAGLSGSNYSFQGTPEAAQRFNSAVSPGEYSQEAQAARNMQREQFLTRQGFEKVDPATGMTPSQMRAMKPTERMAVQKQKTDAQLARETLALNRARTEGDLANQTRSIDSQVAGAGLDQEGKRMTIDEQRRIQGLQKTYNEANTPEEVAKAEKGLIAAGVFKPQTNEFEFVKRKTAPAPGQAEGEEVIEPWNKRTGQRAANAGGDQPQFPKPSTAALDRLKKFKDYDTFKEMFGFIPVGY